jgi:hypothetical protein
MKSQLEMDSKELKNNGSLHCADLQDQSAKSEPELQDRLVQPAQLVHKVQLELAVLAAAAVVELEHQELQVQQVQLEQLEQLVQQV